jgi:hypothetical protein
MASGARILPSSVFSLVLASVLVLTSPTSNQAGQNSAAPASAGETITVWKVGSPYTEDTPDSTIPPDLEAQAEKLGMQLSVKAFPATGFAQALFDAFDSGEEPDVLAFYDYGIIIGAETPLGKFAGIASDARVRRALVEVTATFDKLEWVHWRGRNGWEFLLTTSKHYPAAKRLAMRSPECQTNWPTTPLSGDLQEIVPEAAKPYLEANPASLGPLEDDARLHTGSENPKRRQVVELKTCGGWGNDRLAFAPVVSSYESPKALGHVSALLILRKRKSGWKLLAAATDPLTMKGFVDRLPELEKSLNGSRVSVESILPAQLLSPPDRQYPKPATGQRFGDFTWQRSLSPDCVAEIIEFAYNDDARLFIQFPSSSTPAQEQISDGMLVSGYGLWRWRVWSVSSGGDIVFSDVRSFPH